MSETLERPGEKKEDIELLTLKGRKGSWVVGRGRGAGKGRARVQAVGGKMG